MDTHENDVPEEDLPGSGILDEQFSRKMLREAEENGVIRWDDEEKKYELTARAMMFGIGQAILAAAKEIDPSAGQDEVLEAVLACVPWIGGFVLQGVSEDGEIYVDRRGGDVPDNLDELLARARGAATPLPETWDVPDTLPDNWAA